MDELAEELARLSLELAVLKTKVGYIELDILGMVDFHMKILYMGIGVIVTAVWVVIKKYNKDD